ncbi:MAG: hypothetical protein KatS3mg087_1644 [Patescibacteria group bacterium]|nr:MAG: hypothetical protein KatS3mg087_1644 [Patescibacteria group bacterium]
MNIQFDEEKHEYWVDGERYPSVTEILTDVGLCQFYGDEWHKKRGNLLHKAVEMFFKGTLADAGSFRGHINQLSNWVRATNAQPLLIEQPLAHQHFKYAGKPDVVVKTNDGLKVVEIKSGGQHKHYGWQLAAYTLMVKQKFAEDIGMVCLFIDENSLKAVEFPYSKLEEWLDIIKFYHLKRRYSNGR